jgi:HK97 family phage portal protein
VSVVRDLVRVARPLMAKRQTSPRRLPSASVALLGYNGAGIASQGKDNVRLFRHWSEHSEWIRAAINIRKKQISQAHWSLQPIEHTRPFNEKLAAEITARLNNPNPVNNNWRAFIEPVLEDLLVLDAGCIEKEFNISGAPELLWPVDGATIRVSTIWDGDPEAVRYEWKPDHQVRARLLDRELIYMMDNPATYRVVGLSPLETLKMAIDSELGASSYNDRQMRAPTPDGMLDLGENARPDQVEGFRNFWRAEVAGQGALAIIGGTKNARFVNFRQTNRDAQFLEWQEYLVRKIAAVFMLSPMDLMIERDVNRSTGEQQRENTDDRGLKPLLSTVAGYITREYVWDEAFGGQANNIQFTFTQLNLRESLSRAQINRYATGNLSWKTINEARRDDGHPPLGDPKDESSPYNQLLVNTSGGLASVMDVPTAREYLESKKSEAPSAPDKKALELYELEEV